MKTMKKLLLPALLFTTATTALITPAHVEACGADYVYLYNDFSRVPYAPYNIYLVNRKALLRFVELHPEMLPPAFKFEKGLPSKKAAVKDFQDAVMRYLPKASAEERQKMIAAFSAFMKTWNLKNGLKGYPELPSELDEFRLYLAGCTEMTPEGGETPPPSWMKLLQLPPEKRHYRTVWTHYMLGNYCKKDLHTHYKNCRDAVRAGFADTAGLAQASYKVEVKFGQDPVNVVRTALEALQNDPEYQQPGGDILPWRYLADLESEKYAALVADPVCREVLVIADGHEDGRLWKFVSVVRTKNADVCAFHFYQRGRIDLAEAYLKQQEKPTLISLFLEAKIARYRGNNPRVIKKMRQWLEMVKTAKLAEGSGMMKRRGFWYRDRTGNDSMIADVYGHLGNALLRRRDFVEAAECFYRLDSQLQNLAEVLEIFLPLEEVVAFAERMVLPDIGSRDKGYWAGQVLHLIARRALREGKEDIARKFMTAENIAWLNKLNAYRAKSKDETLSRDDRAIALLNAAKIVRFRGMELYGTQTGPDGYPGSFPNFDSDTTSYLLELITAPKNYRTVPYDIEFRFHYRRTAALMALEAGELAEDKDLKAFIHCFGGEILRNRHPRSADIFYKQLVLQSRGNILSESGDRLRWFPQTMNPMLKKELKRIEPVESLDEVKDLMKRLAESNLGKLIAPETEPATDKK